jgi:chaperonin GroES
MKKKTKSTPTKKETKLRFKPAGDRVLVKPQEAADEKSPSGIIIPDSARKEKPETGLVMAVGEGKRNEKGDVLPMRYKVGDKVMFSKYGYDEITIDDVEYYVISENNILGTF